MFAELLRGVKGCGHPGRSSFTGVILLGGLLLLLSACAQSATPEPTPDLDATLEARMRQQATREAIEARVKEWVAERSTPAPGATPSAILSVDPVPTMAASPPPDVTPGPGGPQLTIERATGAPGQNVTLAVSLDSQTSPVRSVHVNLSYDSERLNGPAGNRDVGLPDGWVFAWHSPTPGDLRFLAFDPSGTGQPLGGVVFTATFTVAADAPGGDAPVSIATQDVRDSSNEALALTVRQGAISVRP